MEQSVLQVSHHDDGRPSGAVAVARLDQPAELVWPLIFDVERYPGRVPMIARVRRDGDRMTVDLKFKISFLSVGFQFVVTLASEAGRWLELRWVSGEPRALRLRFELDPLEGGGACMLRVESELDPQSLGWLAKYFLRNHPEIEHGIFPGVALALVDSIRRAAAAEAACDPARRASRGG